MYSTQTIQNPIVYNNRQRARVLDKQTIYVFLAHKSFLKSILAKNNLSTTVINRYLNLFICH